MELTADVIKQNFPTVYWEIYRAGVADARKDPAFRKQAAQEYLQPILSQASPASPTASALPRPPAAAAISAEQDTINSQLGLSTEIFLKFANAGQQG